jgi:hypothetical protein
MNLFPELQMKVAPHAAPVEVEANADRRNHRELGPGNLCVDHDGDRFVVTRQAPRPNAGKR